MAYHYYNGTNVAPKTKDGKHDLVFTSQESVNHDLRLRSALEARLIFEVLRLAQNEPERIRRVFERHPEFFLYDRHDLPLHENPEGILDRMSVPHVGLIKPVLRTNEPEIEGDILVPPYAPVGYFFQPEENRYLCFFNILTRDAFNLGTKRWLEDEFTEELKRDGLGRLIEIPNQYEGVFGKVYGLRGDPIKIANDGNLLQTMQDMALLHLLYSRFAANSTINGRNPLPFRGEFVNDDRMEELKWCKLIGISHDLTQRLAESGLALCDEYLADIRIAPEGCV